MEEWMRENQNLCNAISPANRQELQLNPEK